jgi:hypothetical protein
MDSPLAWHPGVGITHRRVDALTLADRRGFWSAVDTRRSRGPIVADDGLRDSDRMLLRTNASGRERNAVLGFRRPEPVISKELMTYNKGLTLLCDHGGLGSVSVIRTKRQTP